MNENKICTYFFVWKFCLMPAFWKFLINSENKPPFPSHRKVKIKYVRIFSLLVCVYFVFHKVEMDVYSYDIHIYIYYVLSTDGSLLYQRRWKKVSCTTLPVKSGFEIKKLPFLKQHLTIKVPQLKKIFFWEVEPGRSSKTPVFQSGYK